METTLEHILTNRYKADMISYMNVHPEDFEEAIKLAVSTKQPYSWRAAWLLWSCMEDNDQQIKGSIRNIIDALSTVNDDQLRELLKILHKLELEEELEGILFDVCMSIWEKIYKKPSVRFTAFQMIVKIVRNHPELSHEVLLLTQDHYMDSLSQGIKRSISKMINRIDHP